MNDRDTIPNPARHGTRPHRQAKAVTCCAGDTRKSASGASGRAGHREIAVIDAMPENDPAGFIDNKAEATVLGEERQTVAAFIFSSTPFAQAGEASLLHQHLDGARLQFQSLGDDARVDQDFLVSKFDAGHGTGFLRDYHSRCFVFRCRNMSN